MAFSGLASNETNTASLIQRDISEIVRRLSIKETPVLDWLGDATNPAVSIKHEFIEDQVLPNTIITSTAIASATAATGIQLATAGLGYAFNVGQIVAIRGANPEVMQVTSIPSGGNSLVFTRAYDAGTTGSLAAGGTLYVGAAAGIEGLDHSGADTRRLGTVRTNTVGLFRMELAQSNTQFGLAQVGADRWEDRKAKGLLDLMRQLENEVIKGVLNGANSLATSTTTRTMQGLQSQITAVNSTITSSSFVAAPHKYVGDVWEAMYGNGASPTETWAVIAGSTWFRALSDLNDTKVYDSNKSDLFQRQVRKYDGPFGNSEIFLSRVLDAQEILIIPRERVVVKNLATRSFNYMDMGVGGDNQRGLLTGEYVLEAFHTASMGRAHS